MKAALSSITNLAPVMNYAMRSTAGTILALKLPARLAVATVSRRALFSTRTHPNHNHDKPMNTPNPTLSGLSRRALLTLASLAMLTTATQAQVPTMISYQGRVQMNNTNFGGTGQFKFALVNNNGTVTFWSNNGSSVAGSQPTAAVSLSVANGLTMTLLGDTSLANMTAIPVSVFANTDVRLRVWFNGGSGFQQLTPDQRIVSVGYAMRAETVPDGSITSSKLAAGSVTSAALGDSVALGATNINGRLDVYRTAAGTPGVSLIGGSSQISTYGSDGLEQTRLWGTSYGELLLNNSLANNATAVRLTAQGSTGGQLELRNTNGLSRALLEGENVGGTLTLYQGDGAIGSVLYGNNSGSGALSLKKTNGSTGLNLYGGPTSGSFSLYNDIGNVNLYGYSYGGREGVLSVRNNAGGETVYLWGRDFNGSQDGEIGLKKANGTQTVAIQAGEGAGGSQMLMYNAAGGLTVQLDADASGVAGGYLRLYNSAGAGTITLDAGAGGEGRVTTQVLQITGGSDLSENFEINAGKDALEPGMIVSIDPRNVGELVLSQTACDKRVAGIISGAGGVKTGMLMGQAGTKADGKHPVALTGRVYCWVDAGAGGAIEAGDLITTSNTPGHGMKVTDHARAAGAIIGKAMSSLEKGKGLVLVLVSLQ